MGKAKKKNQDFKKVKLKIGKKLKKPNETATDFNARKVVLFKQLHVEAKPDVAETYQVLSHRQLNIKELCQRMRHHNANVRKDAVSSLRQLVARQSDDQLKGNLKLILENGLILMTDLDQPVRSGLFGLLKEICAKTKPLDFSPTFPLIVAHVVCASTHLNSAVKLFAVKVIALLLDTLPELVRGNAKLLKSYADLLNFKEKNLSRAAKSAVISGLHSILKIIYAYDSSYVGVAKKPSQNCQTNPTCCSLTSGLSSPFDFSLYSSGYYSFGDGLESDQVTFVHVAEKSLDFCHAFWLEITTVDSTNPNAADDGANRFFDADTILDMERLLNIYHIVFDRMTNLSQEMSMNHIDSACRIKFDRLTSTYFKNDKILDHYAIVFPCQFKRRSDNEIRLASACQRINLILCEICLRRLNKKKVANFLGKLKNKENSSEDLVAKLDELFVSLT